jgi:hypothetical protein
MHAIVEFWRTRAGTRRFLQQNLPVSNEIIDGEPP